MKKDASIFKTPNKLNKNKSSGKQKFQLPLFFISMLFRKLFSVSFFGACKLFYVLFALFSRGICYGEEHRQTSGYSSSM